MKQTGPSVKPQISEVRQAARDADPELARRFAAYPETYGISTEHADLLTGSRGGVAFFEAAIAEDADPGAVASWIVTDVRALLGDGAFADLAFTGDALGRLVNLVASEAVSRRAAKDVLARMADVGGDPAELIEDMGLAAVSDTEMLGGIIDGVLAGMPEKVEAYRGGKTNLIGLFIGDVMKATRGAADPKAVRSLLSERLDS